MLSIWEQYQLTSAYDEMRSSMTQSRQSSQRLSSHLEMLGNAALDLRKNAAELAIMEMGISFTVYNQEGNIDRAWPFDIIPRIIEYKEWQQVEAGLKQRLKALNCFIDDMFNEQAFIKDNMIPAYIINSSINFLRECIGMRPRHGAWANICGSDLVRDQDGAFYVLEDNLRVPSGVSYMIENRVDYQESLPGAAPRPGCAAG